jgi:hypothetical protein
MARLAAQIDSLETELKRLHPNGSAEVERAGDPPRVPDT